MVEVDVKKGMPVIGKQFKHDRQQVLNALATLSQEDITALESQLKESGYDAELAFISSLAAYLLLVRSII